jgi:hypothetical protein
VALVVGDVRQGGSGSDYQWGNKALAMDAAPTLFRRVTMELERCVSGPTEETLGFDDVAVSAVKLRIAGTAALTLGFGGRLEKQQLRRLRHGVDEGQRARCWGGRRWLGRQRQQWQDGDGDGGCGLQLGGDNR